MHFTFIMQSPVFQELAVDAGLNNDQAENLAMAAQFVYIDWNAGRNMDVSVAKEAEAFGFSESLIRDAFATL